MTYVPESTHPHVSLTSQIPNALGVPQGSGPPVGLTDEADGSASSAGARLHTERHERFPYCAPWVLANGTTVIIRPICPDDEPLMAQFHRVLSQQSVYLRYFHAIHLSARIAHGRLTQICRRNDDHEIALVAEHEYPLTGARAICAIGRFIRLPDSAEAEFALLIGDPWQRQGLGREVLTRLLAIGRTEGVRFMIADILPDNRGMQRICAGLGFQLHVDGEEKVIKARIDLVPA